MNPLKRNHRLSRKDYKHIRNFLLFKIHKLKKLLKKLVILTNTNLKTLNSLKLKSINYQIKISIKETLRMGKKVDMEDYFVNRSFYIMDFGKKESRVVKV